MSDTEQERRVVFLRGADGHDEFVFSILNDESFEIFDYANPFDAQAQIYNNPPDVVVVSNRASGWRDFVINIKADSFYSHLPILVLIGQETNHPFTSLADLLFDDFLLTPCRREELELRMKIRLLHTRRDLDANPLTRLPGNYTITAMVQERIDSQDPFALGYVDIDNFKAYNDRYGFAHGDDAIRMTSRVLINTVRRVAPEKGFVGHIGGDDFVIIVKTSQIVGFCKETIQNFDLVSPTLFNDEDRRRGWFEYNDRRGNHIRFPLLSISIAVIDSSVTKVNHPGEAAAIASELKGVVKKLNGSNFMIDRRSRV